MVNQTIVLYPIEGISHLVPMVELGKFILKHHPCFSITILITTPHSNARSLDSYTNSISKTNPSITFHYLTPIPQSDKRMIFDDCLLYNPIVQKSLETISTSSTISAFIIDMFCSPSIEVGKKLNIPVYLFSTPSINVLSVLLHLPTVDQNTTKSFKDMDTLLYFPGVPPFHSSDMLAPLLDRTTKFYESFVYYCSQYPKTQGIIVNSFESLEPRALEAIKDGLCVPDGPTPPVYCLGPVMASPDSTGNESSCLEWLDLQPKRSVVLLCFGSWGSFSEAQLKEIATGLEKSGQRFLWVVRAPTDGNIKLHSAPVKPDLDAILPDGFLERTKDRGMVVESWAPQVQVLSRESIGGFVTHCGWNSVLEALCAGVPIVAWPLYAEQRINRVVLVEELKLALPLEEDEGRFVTAEEVEKRVRGLIESEEGRALRERTLKLSAEAKAAISNGGSSVRDLDALAALWKSVT